MKDNNYYGGGLGLASVLTIIFVVLKLLDVIQWSWIWVLAPLWIDFILTQLLLIGLKIYISHDRKKYDKRKWNKWKF